MEENKNGLEEKINIDDLLNGKHERLLEYAITHDLNIKFQCFIINYVTYLQKSIEAAKKGEAVDTEAISAFGDAMRLLLVMQRQYKGEK